MERTNHAMEPRAWAALHFGEVPLGDIRRTRRLQMIGEALASEPGASIPQLFAHPYDVKAAYRFFDHPDVTPERVQSAHRAWVMEQLETAGTYLLLEDTSDLDWTGRASIPGLGPIGNCNESTQGIRLHSVIAGFHDRLARRMTLPPPASAGNGNRCAGCVRGKRWVRRPRMCVGSGWVMPKRISTNTCTARSAKAMALWSVRDKIGC